MKRICDPTGRCERPWTATKHREGLGEVQLLEERETDSDARVYQTVCYGVLYTHRRRGRGYETVQISRLRPFARTLDKPIALALDKSMFKLNSRPVTYCETGWSSSVAVAVAVCVNWGVSPQ